MKEMHYGFFRKWKDFFVHPTYLFESVVFEPLESSFMPLIPALAVVFAYLMVVFQVSVQAMAMRFSVFDYIVLFVMTLFVIHGSFKLLKGEGALSDTFVVWAHVLVFSVLTQLILTVLILLGYFVGKWLMVVFAVISAVISLWAAVSSIIGYMTAHNIGVIRTILAMIVSSIVGGILFLVMYGYLFEILNLPF
jgi:hypothetical protein